MKTTMPGRFIFPFAKLHDIVIVEIQFPKSIITLIIIFRGFGKSTIFMAGMSLWKILYQGYQNVIFASENGDVAREFLLHPKDVVESDDFQKYYGDIRGKIWNERSLQLQSDKLGIHARITSKGSDEQFSGLNMSINGQAIRPQLYFIDDVTNQKKKPSIEQVNYLLDWIDTTIEPSLHDLKSRIFIIGTVYHAFSILSELEKRKSVKTMRFPLLVLGKDKEKISEMLGIPIGFSTWEENPKFATVVMQKKLQEAVEENKLAAFWSQYILEATNLGGSRFREETINFFDINQINLNRLNIYMLIDSAYKKNSKSDETGIVLIGVDKNKNYFILDVVEGKFGDIDFCKKVLSIITKFRLSTINLKQIGIESTMFDWISAILRRFLADAGYSFPITELSHQNRSKSDRIRRLILPADEGRLHIQKHQTTFKAQLLLFDSEAKDLSGFNALDACAYIEDIGYAPDLIDDEESKKKENERLWAELMGQDAYFYGTLGKYFDIQKPQGIVQVPDRFESLFWENMEYYPKYGRMEA